MKKAIQTGSALIPVLVLALALPAFIWAATKLNLNVLRKAATGEPLPSPIRGYVITESFETDSNKDNLPDNWTPRNLDANDKLITYAFYDGKKSFQFSPSSDINKREWITRKFNVTGVSDEEIRLKVFNRVGKNITSGKAGVILSILYTDGRVETTSGVFPYKQHNWKEKTLVLVSDGKYSQIRIQFFNTNIDSNVLIDAISVDRQMKARSRGVKETPSELPQQELETLIEK